MNRDFQTRSSERPLLVSAHWFCRVQPTGESGQGKVQRLCNCFKGHFIPSRRNTHLLYKYIYINIFYQKSEL